jgi:CubicO group peptidase (beta-lactamase class C family)
MRGVERLRFPRGRGSVQLTGMVVCVVLVITGCSAGSSPASTGSAQAGATQSGSSPLKMIDPAALAAAVDGTAKELMIPGALVQVRTPQGDYTAAAGTTQRGAEVTPGGDTQFRIASITKTMTSAAVVLLAQEGKLHFGDPISKYVPNVPNGENITIADLLKMRSGLYGYTNDPEFAATLDAEPTKVWTPPEVLAIAFRHPPEFPPGSAYDYSNTNYVLLGLVVEKVDGRPLGQVFQDRFLGALGLKQTTLPAIVDTSLPDPYSHGYMYGGSAFAMVDMPYPPEMQAAAKTGALRPTDYTHQNSSYAWAPGGVTSTANDLATWIRALVDGRVFNADFQRQWLDSPLPADPAEPAGPQYGYGIERQTFAPNATMYYHFGEMPGFNTFSGYDPANKVTLVIWSNLTVAPDSRPTANTLLASVIDQIYSLPPRVPPSTPPTTR